ncbi:MAG: methylenetetrahydrofolate reductase C-terminal domain-containing protein, partial [Microbacterium sp.]|uniref:methylenetetrahydrofolate reductase C-terminal domain-containing protein n=1 Tax=Microbacterium sp. TaxID=51671 RepID=UPI0039E378FC
AVLRDPSHRAPSHRAAAAVAAGVPVVVELGGRDRNRVAIEGELAALADAGAAGVVIAAGEGPAVDDLSPERIAALVDRAGLLALRRDAAGALRPFVATDAARTTCTDAASPADAAACPKAMSYGPCGGVEADGSCEIRPQPCVFLGATLPIRWHGVPPRDVPAPTPAGRELRAIMARRPLVLTGFPVRAMRAEDVAPVADALRTSADAVLSGDAGRSRVQFPPAYRALLMARAGMRVWMGLTARDRNRVALEEELASLREIGVAGVHCVTGDHTLTGDRPDAKPVFDLESTTMLPRARAHGLLASFAESPAAPPAHVRGGRVREKQRAGGQLCLTQYCGDAADVADFVALCREAGATAPVLPGVPLVVDRAGAQLLASFHAAKLPTGYVERLFAARDVRAEGIRLAVEYGRELLAVAGVGGVVVAGGGAIGGELDYARALATVAAELGGGS